MTQAYTLLDHFPEKTTLSYYYDPDPDDYYYRDPRINGYYRRRRRNNSPWMFWFLLAMITGLLAGMKLDDMINRFRDNFFADTESIMRSEKKAATLTQDVTRSLPFLKVCDTERGGREHFINSRIKMSGFVEAFHVQDQDYTWIHLRDLEQPCTIWVCFSIWSGQIKAVDTGKKITVEGTLIKSGDGKDDYRLLEAALVGMEDL